ncbi:MAG: T9SS type A sorting domain-containing protein [Melioribacteraceae bacterium]|nr:T9SS type A sorting domain-containing protein [Melioribacteraceae bacterium]
MKKILLFSFVLILSNFITAQEEWNVAWKMLQKPFMYEGIGSEMSIVKAGFDTDQDGKGEFLCAWTDLDSNYTLMYEANGDDTYELVWHWKHPVSTNSFAMVEVGDVDNNGVVDLVFALPSAVSGDDPNPLRLWAYTWTGVVGENEYGIVSGFNPGPTSYWNFDLEDNVDFRPYSLIIEDIDSDGKNELIVGQRNSSENIHVLVCSVDEFNFFSVWKVEYEYSYNAGGGVYNVTTGDLDNDGNREIYVFTWDLFTFTILECTGEGEFTEAFSVKNLYSDAGIDYGALESVRVADADNDGDNELYIAGTESDNALFIIDNVTDVEAITADDIKLFYKIPAIAEGKLRTMHIADPDDDGNIDLMIAGERNGQIYKLEYAGSGSPSDSANWNLDVIFDVWDYSGFSPDSANTLSPRFFYGSPATDMDGDGKSEYLFVNYSNDQSEWADDPYLWIIESSITVGVEKKNDFIPNEFSLKQNYPNPFNPSTTIEYSIPSNSEYVEISVFDILGNEIVTLVNEEQDAGNYRIRFNAAEYNLSSGIYFYKLNTNNFSDTKKLMLIK